VLLLLLTVVQAGRTRRAARARPAGTAAPEPAADDKSQLAKALEFAAWTVLLLGLIVVAGHYVGIATFMFVLLKSVSGRDAVFALAVAASVTLALFILFEIGFEIELYRGVIYRALAGYKIF
jgi:hypothetical protein